MTIEVDGMLWKPLPRASASAAEFTQARSLVNDDPKPFVWTKTADEIHETSRLTVQRINNS